MSGTFCEGIVRNSQSPTGCDQLGMSLQRPTADIVADLNLPTTVRFCAASVAVNQYRIDASERLADLEARLAAIHAALDKYEKDRMFKGHAALTCVADVAMAVGR